MGMFIGKISKKKGTKNLNNDNQTPQSLLDKAITMRELEHENEDLRYKSAKAVEALEQISRFFVIGEASSCHDVEKLIMETLEEIEEGDRG